MPGIVITGAGGFVGRNLIPFLEAAGWPVIPVSLRRPDWRTLIPDSADCMIHLAGLAHDLHDASRPEDYFRINTGLTAEVYDFFLGSGITGFVYFSSVKAVADSLGDAILGEDHFPSPGTPYGLSKRRAEEYILSRPAAGKRVHILRPAMIHGPGNKGNLNLLYRLVSTGIPWPLAAFENSRSYLSIDNLAFIVREVCAGRVPEGVYNAADSGFLSTNEVVAIINEARGRTTRAWRIDPSWVGRLARIGTRLRLPFDEARLAKLTESYRVDNGKLLHALDRGLPLTVGEGLAKTIQSFRE